MTVRDYLDQNDLVSGCKDEYLDWEVLTVQEQCDCYRIFIQPGFFITAELLDLEE